jgi:hypothetical protein
MTAGAVGRLREAVQGREIHYRDCETYNGEVCDCVAATDTADVLSIVTGVADCPRRSN